MESNIYTIIIFSLFVLFIFIILNISSNEQIQEHMEPITVKSNEAIQNAGEIFNSGNATITNLTTTQKLSTPNISMITGPMKCTISSGTASPNAIDINYGDGSGWKANFGKSGSPLASIDDKGNMTGTQFTVSDPTNTYTILNDTAGLLSFNSKGGAGGSIKMGSGGDLYTSYIYTAGDIVNGGNLKTTGTITAGAVTGNQLTATGGGASLSFQDRANEKNVYSWYSYGGPAYMWNTSTNGNIISLDATGNLDTLKGNLTTNTIKATNLDIGGIILSTLNGQLTINGVPFSLTVMFIRIYAGGNTCCNDGGFVWGSVIKDGIMQIGWVAKDLSDRSQVFYWNNNILYHAPSGNCMQDDGKGNIILAPYDINKPELQRWGRSNDTPTDWKNYFNMSTRRYIGQWTNGVVSYYGTPSDPQAIIREINAKYP